MTDPNARGFAHTREQFQQLVEDALALARTLGASEAGVEVSEGVGLSVSVRKGEVENVERNRDKSLGITVYVGKRRGNASTSDFSRAALEQTVRAAHDIARFTAEDPAAGLPEVEDLAFGAAAERDLDLYHPWPIVAEQAVEIALRCEAAALETDRRITNSDGAGVWITATAGSGNLVRPNQIYDNGKSGTGLGIDLGTPGALLNDPLDGDGGPNNGQNWPQINGSVANPDGTRAVTFTLNSNPNTTVRVDIYRAPDCPAGNRGANLSTRINTVIGTTNAQGVLNATFNMSGVGAPGQLSAIATSATGGDTSEPGACYAEPSGNSLFANGFE